MKQVKTAQEIFTERLKHDLPALLLETLARVRDFFLGDIQKSLKELAMLRERDSDVLRMTYKLEKEKGIELQKSSDVFYSIRDTLEKLLEVLEYSPPVVDVKLPTKISTADFPRIKSKRTKKEKPPVAVQSSKSIREAKEIALALMLKDIYLCLTTEEHEKLTKNLHDLPVHEPLLHDKLGITNLQMNTIENESAIVDGKLAIKVFIVVLKNFHEHAKDFEWISETFTNKGVRIWKS